MSNSDITTKIEVILSSILSKKHDAKIKIKFVDSEEVQDEQGRDNYETGEDRSITGKRDLQVKAKDRAG